MDSNKYIEVFLSCPLFRNMDAETVGEILSGYTHRMVIFDKGDPFAITGQPCRYADILVEGTLVCRMSSPAGKEVEVSRLTPGRVVAPAFIFATNNAMPVTVQAATNAVVLRWQKETFRTILAQDSRVQANFITLLSDTNAFLTRKLNMLSLMTVREKVANLLIQRAMEQKTRQIVLFRSRQEIADSMGIQKFSLMRVLSEFEKEGAIKIDGRNIEIIDSRKLK